MNDDTNAVEHDADGWPVYGKWDLHENIRYDCLPDGSIQFAANREGVELYVTRGDRPLKTWTPPTADPDEPFAGVSYLLSGDETRETIGQLLLALKAHEGLSQDGEQDPGWGTRPPSTGPWQDDTGI